MKSSTTACSSYFSASPSEAKQCFVERIKEEDSAAPIKEDVTSKPSKRKRTAISKKTIPTLINLVKQKPSVKSPLFMNSTGSIFAAVCKCDSLLQSLCCDETNMAMQSQDSIFAMVDDHFGACPIFKQTFETSLAAFQKSSSSPATSIIIEQILHTSVRHLCSNECFLRAYLPIREFCLLWRDITIHESIGTTKEELLREWRCRLVPRTSQVMRPTKTTSCVDDREHKRKNTMSIIYLSQSGAAYRTKTSVIKFMNRNYCNGKSERTTLEHSPMKVKGGASSKIIRIVSPTKCSSQQNVLIHHSTNLNPLFSPLGLLEELFVNNPWRLLVSTICLNVTTRRQVDSILHAFLEQWPTAEATANTDWEEVSAVISPMGLGIKRAKGLVRFSAEYIELTKNYDEFSLSEKQVTGLFFCGLYSWSAYKIFIRGELPSGAVESVTMLFNHMLNTSLEEEEKNDQEQMDKALTEMMVTLRAEIPLS